MAAGSGKPRRTARAPRKSAAPFARRLVIMVKEPVAGRVKTRLARDVGAVRAVGFYRSNTAAVIARLARDTRWRTLLSVAPDTALASRAWPARLVRIAQGPGDLGKRMQRILDRRAPGPTLVVGTDIPAIRNHHIADAFRRLGGADAVLGPTPDGGYWLVGQRRSPRTLCAFERVRWSSPHALSDTCENLRGRRIATAAMLTDVDEAPDLDAAQSIIGRRVLPA